MSWFLFVCAGDVTKMKTILKENPNVDIDQGDYDLRTALHLAAAEGNQPAVDFLITAGADVNAVDRLGATPLEDALHAQHNHVILALRKAGLRYSPTQLGMALCVVLCCVVLGVCCTRGASQGGCVVCGCLCVCVVLCCVVCVL